MKNEVIETRSAKLYLGKDGICRSLISAAAEITIDDVKEHFAAFSKITGGKRTPYLIDLRGIKSLTREARENLSDKETLNKVSASALLIDSPLSKVIGNFFIGISKPPYPTKMFTSEEKAIEWLKGFVEKGES